MRAADRWPGKPSAAAVHQRARRWRRQAFRARVMSRFAAARPRTVPFPAKGREMRKLISVLAGAVAALLAYGTASAAPALPFGLYESSNDLQYSFAAVPDYAIQFYGWQEAFQATAVQDAWNAGTESFLELQTCGNPCDQATSVPLAGVIAGNYDTYLTDFADAAAAFGHPVLM